MGDRYQGEGLVPAALIVGWAILLLSIVVGNVAEAIELLAAAQVCDV